MFPDILKIPSGDHRCTMAMLTEEICQIDVQMYTQMFFSRSQDDISRWFVVRNKVVLRLECRDSSRPGLTHPLVALQGGEHNWVNKILERFFMPVSIADPDLAFHKDLLAVAGISRLICGRRNRLELPGDSTHVVDDVVFESPFLIVVGESIPICIWQPNGRSQHHCIPDQDYSVSWLSFRWAPLQWACLWMSADVWGKSVWAFSCSVRGEGTSCQSKLKGTGFPCRTLM